jgi:hypothetical protein
MLVVTYSRLPADKTSEIQRCTSCSAGLWGLFLGAQIEQVVKLTTKVYPLIKLRYISTSILLFVLLI